MQYTNFLKYLDQLQENVIKPGLERMQEVCKFLGNPENNFKSIHIAGTNGKGSTAVFLESILRNNGYRVGLYTSPHLVDVRERIQIDRQLISETEICELAEVVKQADVPLTYFEFLTVIAFLYFTRQEVDIAILETGLGGRWDATNVVAPLLTLMTPISVDHTSFLGDDVKSITLEKCGIVKQGIPLVTLKQREDVDELVRSVCLVNDSMLVISEAMPDFPEISLPGDHQKINAALAINAAAELNKLGYNVTKYRDCLKDVYWPGRFQKIGEDPEIILDGAHNPAACDALANHLKKEYSDRDIIIIFGAMKDKKIREMADSLRSVATKWILYGMDGERAATPSEIKSIIENEATVVSDPAEAISEALKLNLKNPLIVVCGSLYLVGKFIKELND